MDGWIVQVYERDCACAAGNSNTSGTSSGVYARLRVCARWCGYVLVWLCLYVCSVCCCGARALAWCSFPSTPPPAFSSMSCSLISLHTHKHTRTHAHARARTLSRARARARTHHCVGGPVTRQSPHALEGCHHRFTGGLILHHSHRLTSITHNIV